MPSAQFRIYADSKPLSTDELNRIENITVEQEVDMAWEGRIELPIRLNDKGSWIGEDDKFMEPFSRMRIELQTGTTSFLPLIDGPVVGIRNYMHSSPGQSKITIVIHDDSAYLNLSDEVVYFENIPDHEIARRLLSKFSEIKSQIIETTPAAPGRLSAEIFQRGTAIKLLRFLAHRNGMYGYVAPGKNPGESIGCFKNFPVKTTNIPPLKLIGSDRNLEFFDVIITAQKPTQVTATTLYIEDKSINTNSVNYSALQLSGDEKPFSDSAYGPSTLILLPGTGESVELNQALMAEMKRSGQTIEAAGKINGDSYNGILIPYELVTVKAGDTPLSGDYEIHQVTHSVTRSQYTQTFKLKRNAVTKKSGSQAKNLTEKIF